MVKTQPHSPTRVGCQTPLKCAACGLYSDYLAYVIRLPRDLELSSNHAGEAANFQWFRESGTSSTNNAPPKEWFVVHFRFQPLDCCCSARPVRLLSVGDPRTVRILAILGKFRIDRFPLAKHLLGIFEV